MEELEKARKKAISTILRSSNFQPWGLALLNKEIIEIQNEEIPTPAFTTGKYIFLNTSHKMFSKYNLEKLIPLFLLHEISHIMFYHNKRLKNRDPNIFNIAGDYVINLILRDLDKEDDLTDLGIPDLDKQDICLDPKFEKMTEEQVYDYLIKNQVNKSSSKAKLGDLSDNIDSSIQDVEVEIEKTEIEMEDGNKKESIQVKVPDSGDQEKVDNSENQDELDKQIKLSRNLLEQQLSRGTGSSPGELVLKKLLKVKVDWTKILKDALRTHLQPSTETSWGEPRRIWLANPIMPYLPSFPNEEHFGLGIVSIDESGSMPDEEVKKAVDVIKQFNNYFKRILILKHDSKIVWESMVENFEEVNLEELLVRKSRGGTSHKDIFDRIIQESKKEQISLYISITDMMSDIEEYQHKITSVPIIYLTSDKISGRSFDQITGKVIKMEEC